MNWFGYIWIGLIAIPYIIWTIDAIKDFIDSVGFAKHFGEPLQEEFEIYRGWGLWFVIHLAVLFISSLGYCMYYFITR